MTIQWYDNESLFYDETRILNECFPQFEFGYENEDIILKGELRTNRGNYYKLKVEYPKNFPRTEPEIYIEEAKINGNTYNCLPWFGRTRAHMYTDYQVCWNDRNRAGSWDPDRSTAVHAINIVATWLFSYESFVIDKDDKWLGSDHIY